MTHVDVAIIGAGIAGLSAAVALAQKGIRAQVFEAAPALKPMGTSLSIWPNAMQCLGDWGLAEAITAAGAQIDRVAWRDKQGRAFFDHDMTSVYDRFGTAGVCVRRADAHDILAGAIPAGALSLDHALAGCEVHSDHVALQFENGALVSAGLVIAADGLWSKLRAQVLPRHTPRYSGYGAYLGLSPAPAPDGRSGEAGEYIAAKARMGVFETGGDTRYWFVVVNDPAPHPSACAAQIGEVLDHLKDWPEELRNLVTQTEPDQLIHASFYQANVRGPWGTGRIVCIGDAMHPFVPNLGQGACQAIEDGHALARALKAGVARDAVPDWMARMRGARVLALQKQAAQIGKLVQGMGGLHMPILTATRLVPNLGVLDRSFTAQFNMS